MTELKTLRDVEVRDLAKSQLDLCKKCINRFTKEELIKIMQGRIDKLAGNKLIEEKQ